MHPSPIFPPNVLLHPDDASSKVFLAIAKAFVSVDNRAMTIKDIAERASEHGLVCQNLSAAAQAVTTYLRAHKARCDKQQDQPLLLSHTLSGTPADDDLLPALFSRSGGDSAHPAPGRSTNFRKGTAVWYLSRATGFQCPFTRNGIRLCDYVPREDPHNPADSLPRRDRRTATPACGDKRKRTLRGSAPADPDDAEPPPKVKLTLRLKPLLTRVPLPPPPSEGSSSDHPIPVSESSDDESVHPAMSVDAEPPAQVSTPQEDDTWALPPYPRRSISIPSYTPVAEHFPTDAYTDSYRRSPSTFATPPPESDDEADDYHLAMARLQEEENDGWDADDSEGEEGDTVWEESPGPRSPSAPLVQPAEVTVKQEPNDVQGMLDAWEDFDQNLVVKDVVTKTFEKDLPQIKLEPIDPWDWDAIRAADWPAEDLSHIKQEDFGVDMLFPPDPSSPLSPLSALSSQFAAFSYADASDPDDVINPEHAAVRPRSHTVPAPSSVPATALSAPPLTRPSLSSSSLYTSPRPACVSPLATRCQPSFPLNRAVVVTTCQPCKPAISATQIEDISVYQMMLGAFQLLRRIDTDFVNLSPILAIAGAPLVHTPKNATVVTKGSPEVSGIWVPLAAAQAYVEEHVTPAGKVTGEEMHALEMFLSDTLVELFPPALQDFHRTTPTLGQFGRHFASTLQAARWETDGAAGSVGSSSPSSASSMMAPTPSPPPSQPQSHFLGPVGLGLGLALALSAGAAEKEDAPLNDTEQQLFRELCVLSDSEGDDAMAVDGPLSPMSALSDSPLSSPLSSPTMEFKRVPAPPPPVAVKAPTQHARTESTETQRPLRRSKRVADALAAPVARAPAATRTRSRKGGAGRSSLS